MIVCVGVRVNPLLCEYVSISSICETFSPFVVDAAELSHNSSSFMEHTQNYNNNYFSVQAKNYVMVQQFS